MRTKKSLGQNFLNDTKVIFRFIDVLAPTPIDTFIEIGPGKGAVTFRLLPRCKKVIAIEKDDLLAQRLTNKANRQSLSNLTIINKDYFSAEEEISQLVNDPDNTSLLYISSLPYNVSKKILFSLLYEEKGFKKGAFIIQKEVAEDYCSAIPNAAFLSRVVSLVATCEYMFTIPKENFTPMPKVTSAVIKITRKDPLIDSVTEQIDFLKFVRTLYQFKRKVIRNSLKKMFSTTVADELISKFRLENKRVEEVDLTTLVTLYKKCGNLN
ncbi:ribosomal RNA small subunit methyltransferase A [Candidatus Dojkabacteria bacterium]|nr:ribosomal RNA small subunit methyltransferase A [Candidatus Dojkabacteria bacterium]